MPMGPSLAGTFHSVPKTFLFLSGDKLCTSNILCSIDWFAIHGFKQASVGSTMGLRHFFLLPLSLPAPGDHHYFHIRIHSSLTIFQRPLFC